MSSMTPQALAAEYSRLSCQAGKAYRKLAKELGFKGRGNPGCGAKTFSDYEMTAENTAFVAQFIANPSYRKFYAEFEDPIFLLFGFFGPCAGINPDPAFTSALERFRAIRNAAQREWEGIYR